MPRSLVCLAAGLLSGLSFAVVDYRVSVRPDVQKLEVSVAFDAGPGPVAVRMPNWAPGAYVFRENYRAVTDLAVTVDGAAVTANQTADRWEIPARAGAKVMVSYRLPLTVDETSVCHWSGPSSYLYVEGRTQEACRLWISAPEGWTVAHGLPDTAAQPWAAPTYDVLADNPVSCGNLRVLSYVSGGARHDIVMRGKARDFVNDAAVVEFMKKISDTQIGFFGSYPDTKYVWHFAVGDRHDGGGGLEHLSSTQITLASGLQDRVLSVCSHEYFHLWNVKRIRSKVLGPFDYTQLPQTGALWWLEGVTDYYADLLLVRSGVVGEAHFWDKLNRNVSGAEANPAYRAVSPFDSSWRQNEMNEGRGNSNGFQISFYTLGWMAGFCLDVELRERTGGRYSLDSVVRRLNDLCRDGQPGFEEGKIREIFVEMGGAEMGAFFDRVVMRPGPQPIAEQLEKVGMAFRTKARYLPDLGVVLTSSVAKGGMDVTRLAEGRTGLAVGDVVTQINGLSMAFDSTWEMVEAYEQALGTILPGATVALTVKGADGTVRTVSWDAGARVADQRSIEPLTGSGLAERRLRSHLIAGR